MELISRDEVMRLAESGKLLSGSFGERAKDIIKAIPTIEERKVGRWIDKGRDDDVYDIKGVKTWATKGMCSECGFTTWFIESYMCYAYCPQCGSYNATKMKGE